MKLQMVLKPDPKSGDLVASMPVLPPFPLSEIDLEMPAASGVVKTAVRCGPYVGSSTMTPWNPSPLLEPGFEVQPLPLSTGPGGTPCPGAPTGAHVALAPTHIVANGKSTVTATALVTDADGIPVPGETVEFSSSDPGQAIGPVLDNEDGTYSAAVTSSTAVGTPTITATVVSAEPELSGSAQLRQDPIPSPTAGTPAVPQAENRKVIPTVSFGKHPPRRTRRHRAVFTFRSDVAGSSFFCKLDGRPYRPCPSPTRLSGLGLGQHHFNVYAVSPSGSTGVPASLRFTVLPPKRPRAG